MELKCYTFYKCTRFRQLNKNSGILIYQTKNEISIISIYIDKLLPASNIIVTLNRLKKLLNKQQEIKNLEKLKTIFSQQITRDLVVDIIKINQPVFVKDLVIKKGIINCNVNIILIKEGLIIQMTDLKIYEKTK